MTQEEKLEEAKRLYETANADQRYVLESLFPELKESEDEKIRNWLIGYFHQYKEDGMEKYANGLKVESIIAWLEKQGEQKSVPIDKVVNFLNENLINDKDEITGEPFINFQNYGAFKESFISYFKRKMIEKQGEKKPTDKVEPKDYSSIDPHFAKPIDTIESKFKVGDWVIYECGEDSAILQIKNIIDNTYEFTDDSTLNVADENTLRLWTIQDAKDGDVLVDNNNNIGIYQHIEGTGWYSYIYLGCDKFLHGFSCGGFHPQIYTKPATKEQRDALIKALADEGYIFDFKKKELKKM